MRVLPTLPTSLLLLWLCFVPATAFEQVGVSITVAPPALPVYVQPPVPVEGYIWTPGYWAYGPLGYYWVAGVWVPPPRPGVLWTPGYWAFGSGAYLWHAGYWGPSVGYYGGINYGFGYTGVGYVGGMWAGDVFRYNTAVTSVNTSVVRNVYVNRTLVDNTTVVNRASFNGTGGVMARPGAGELAAMHEEHLQATANQLAHEQAQSRDRYALAALNHGAPRFAAMDRVDGRRYNQQGRIAQGVASSQLTAAETRNLETREAGLNREIHSERTANGGALTPQERRQVNQQQNNLSHSIYDDKHNAATQHYGNNEAGARRYNQQQRIAAGVQRGQMAPAEAARAEKHEQRINHQVAADRGANGGRLTPEERGHINHEQNAASHQIYHEKHNEKVAPR